MLKNSTHQYEIAMGSNKGLQIVRNSNNFDKIVRLIEQFSKNRKQAWVKQIFAEKTNNF